MKKLLGLITTLCMLWASPLSAQYATPNVSVGGVVKPIDQWISQNIAAIANAQMTANGAVQSNGDGSLLQVTTPNSTNAKPRSLGARFTDSINVVDFGAKCDGITDDTIAINNAEIYMSSRGGGEIQVVNHGAACMVSGPIVHYSFNTLRGQGNPSIKAMPGPAFNVIEGQSYQTLTGTDSGPNGIHLFSIRDLTIDGNSSNETDPASTIKGSCIAFVGAQFHIVGVTAQNCYRHGLWSEYASGSTYGGYNSLPFGGHVLDLTISNTGGHGWYNNVSDLHFEDANITRNGLLTNNTYCGFYSDVKGGVRGTTMNLWNSGVTGYNLPKYEMCLYSDGNTINGAHLEMGATANLYIASNNNNIFGLNSYNNPVSQYAAIQVDGGSNHINGQVYPGASGSTGLVAVQLGTTATPPKNVNQNTIQLHVYNITNGLVDWTNSFGTNKVDIQHSLSSGALMSIGSPKTGDQFYTIASGVGGDTRWNGTGAGAVQFGGTASAQNAIAIGSSTNASSGCTAIGTTNTCVNFSQLATGSRANTDTNWGARCHSGGQIVSQGDAEICDEIWRGVMTTSSTIHMWLNNIDQQLVIPVNSTYGFDRITLVCKLNNGGAVQFEHTWSGSITRASAAASIDGTMTQSDVITPITGWSAVLTAGNSGVIDISVTGVVSATSVNCVASTRLTKVSG